MTVAGQRKDCAYVSWNVKTDSQWTHCTDTLRSNRFRCLRRFAPVRFVSRKLRAVQPSCRQSSPDPPTPAGRQIGRRGKRVRLSQEWRSVRCPFNSLELEYTAVLPSKSRFSSEDRICNPTIASFWRGRLCRKVLPGWAWFSFTLMGGG